MKGLCLTSWKQLNWRVFIPRMVSSEAQAEVEQAS